MPVKPLRPETVIVDVADEPLGIVSVVGLAERLKSEEAVKVAVCTFSGTVGGLSSPFTTSTHVVVPETLLSLQPVSYPMGVPVVGATTLYTAVNSKPVVGKGLKQPKHVMATCIVSGVSVDAQLGPEPPTHSTSTMKVGAKTNPVRSTPEGCRIVWSARTVTSKPLKGAEFCMNTATRS